MSSARALPSAFIVDAVRTPIARFKGGLASVRADDLAAHVLTALGRRNPALVEKLDQIVFGATNQAGEDNRDVARMAGLLAGLPYEVPAVTVNRLCGSGLEAVCDAVRRVVTGDADVVVAGGVESMTRAPFAFGKTDEAFSRTPPKTYDTTIGWPGFEEPRGWPERFPLVSPWARPRRRSRPKWRRSAARSRTPSRSRRRRRRPRRWRRAPSIASSLRCTVPAKAGSRGAEAVVFARDESPRGDTTLEALAKLAPAFRKGGSVTAGNSSPINDGASAVLVVSEEVVRANGLGSPWPESSAHAAAGVHPGRHGRRPDPGGVQGAGPGRLECERPRPRGAERGVRGPGDRVRPRARARSGSRQRQRRSRLPSATPSASSGARILRDDCSGR